MNVKIRMIINTIMKNKITAFDKGKFFKTFIFISINNKKKYLNQWL